jgi:hypothetical protein
MEFNHYKDDSFFFMDNLFNTNKSLVPSPVIGVIGPIIKNGDPSTNDENLIERNDRNILFKKVNSRDIYGM